MRRFVAALWVVGALIVVSFALSYVHPFGDPRAENVAETDSPSTLLMSHAMMPVEARSVLREKCADCHSYQTHWPWYGRFAPVSWLLEYDIEAAQEQLNLSQWDALPDEDILRLRVEIAGVTRAHMMPPWRYTLLHRDAVITDDDIKVLRDWARGDVTSKLGVAEKTPADARPGDAGRGRWSLRRAAAAVTSCINTARAPSWPVWLAARAGRSRAFCFPPR